MAQFPPIAGYEELRYHPEILRLGPVPEGAELLLETDGIAVRLHARGPGEKTLSWALETPFQAWPPAAQALPSPPVTNSVPGPLEAATWPAAHRLALGPGREARWVAPEREAGVGPTPRGTSFVCSLRDGYDLVVERADVSDDSPVGYIPLAARYARSMVARDGTLWLAAADRRDPGVVDLFHVESSVRCLGSMPCPAWRAMLELEGFVERSEGAWLLFRGRCSIVARAVDRSGIGSEWTTGWAVMGIDSTGFAAWRDGFVVSVVRSVSMFDPDSERRIVLLACDGKNTTRALGAPGHEPPQAGGTAVLAGPDGRAVLIAYLTASDLVVGRADFAAGDGAEDPWQGDAEVIAKTPSAHQEQTAEVEDESEPLFHAEARPTCREVIDGLRATALATALFVMAHPSMDEDAYRGDGRRGSYLISNGQGDLMVFAWNENGIVATAFDHELSDDSDVPIEERRPFRFLGAIPRRLMPLAQKAFRLAEHSVTGGFWMTDTDGRRGGDLMTLLRYVFVEDGAGAPSRSEAEMKWDVVSDRLLAASTKPTLTEDDAAVLLAAGEVEAKRFDASGKLTPRGAKLGAKKLGKLGITWCDPVRDLERSRR